MRRPLVAALALLAACERSPDVLPPVAQAVLYFATDAPLPAGPGQPPTGSPALFDSLEVEVFPPGSRTACDGCSRQLGVDARMIGGGQASFGIVPPATGDGTRVRLRLFWARGGAPARPDALLETVLLLPSIPADTVLEISTTLRTDQVGVPVGDLDHPALPDPGPARPDLVGTWPGARRVLCKGKAWPGEACVPGGAFWMGDPRLWASGWPLRGGGDERLVVVSPFFLDAREVSVADFRASGLARPAQPDGTPADPEEAGALAGRACTYTHTPGSNQDRPVNCLSWDLAARYCESLGKRLPTEAQFEYVAGGLASAPFVWGEDAPRCGDAVSSVQGGESCPAHVQPEVSGSGSRDRLALPGGEILDLGGNLREWTRDLWNRDPEPCWAAHLLYDPECTVESPADGRGRTVRGGSFASGSPIELCAAWREGRVDSDLARDETVGFRCARADGP